MKILGSRLQVKKLPRPTTTPSGIVLPQIREEEHADYVVLRTGPKVPTEIQPGDRVAIKPYCESHILPDHSRIVDSDSVMLLL